MSSKPFSFDDDLQEMEEAPSDLAKVSELLLNDEFPRVKTILPDRLISALTTLDSIAESYEIAWLKDHWIPKYCQYLISKDGQGRKDIVGIAQAGLERREEHFSSMMEVMGRR